MKSTATFLYTAIQRFGVSKIFFKFSFKYDLIKNSVKQKYIF